MFFAWNHPPPPTSSSKGKKGLQNNCIHHKRMYDIFFWHVYSPPFFFLKKSQDPQICRHLPFKNKIKGCPVHTILLLHCCERSHVFRWIKTSETATGTQVFFVHDEYVYITTWTRVTAQYGAIHNINLVLSLQLLPVYIKHFRFTQVEVVS